MDSNPRGSNVCVGGGIQTLRGFISRGTSRARSPEDGVSPGVVLGRHLPVKPVRLPQPGVEPFPGSEAINPERVSIYGIVHPDATEAGEPQSPESRIVRKLLDRIPRAGSERLEEEATNGVEKLLSNVGRELGEFVLRLLVGDVAGRHPSPPAPPEHLMDSVEFTGREPTSLLRTPLQLCQPVGRVVVLQQIEQELVPSLPARLPML